MLKRKKDSNNLNLKNIGSLIKAKRKEMGYTQEELADKVGISAQHCSRIERGEYIPSLQTFLVIVEVLNLDISKLQLKDDMDIIESYNKDNLLARLVDSNFDLSILP